MHGNCVHPSPHLMLGTIGIQSCQCDQRRLCVLALMKGIADGLHLVIDRGYAYALVHAVRLYVVVVFFFNKITNK
jgi:hypothetical protein